MPQENLDNDYNSEEINEIITAVPPWILRWGITTGVVVLAGLLAMSAIIEYPDIVSTELTVNSLNSPKKILGKRNGKLVRLLVKDGESVSENQPIAYMESTANHGDVISLNKSLKKIQKELLSGNGLLALSHNLNIGELQGSYQNFYSQYLQYLSTQKNGYYLNRISLLEKDLAGIQKLKNQIVKQRGIQELEYANQKQEYEAYQKLYKGKVISRSEFSQQENKYLSAKYPLQQTESSLLSNSASLLAKEKELLELRHTIADEQAKFGQALNQCVSEIEQWIKEFIVVAPMSGKLSYAGIVQVNQNIIAGQEIFVVDPGNTDFFGEIEIPQENMGKIHVGEFALIKLKSYPFEQYGMIRGKLSYIADVAYQDSIFLAKVSFGHIENKVPERKVILRNGMRANVEIITQESSLLQRFFRSITKMLNP